MALRTYRYFACPNGHRGEEKTTENDQPYSQEWESVRTTGIKGKAQDSQGRIVYLCEQCGAAMQETTEP